MQHATAQRHWGAWPEPRRTEFAALGALVSDVAGRGGAEGATPEACARLLAALAVNAMTVTDAEQREVGIALYRQAARLNHGAAPNAVQTFRGRTLVLRAARPVLRSEHRCKLSAGG